MAATQQPYLAGQAPVAIAHRGSAAHHPENTMAAFAHAVDLGYRYLETDARISRDDVLLAFHDDRLDRVTDGAGLVAAQDWAQLQHIRVHGREPIPLMEDLLAAWPDVMVNIDAKSDEVVEPLVQTIGCTASVDRICIGSFSDSRLRRFRDAFGPRLCTSMGPREVMRLRLGSFGLPRGRFAAACVQIPEVHRGVRLIDWRLLRLARKLGLHVHVWTVNDAADMQRLLDLGVDGLMTDETETLKQVFETRGLWR